MRNPERKIRILSIDGGGMRGVIPARMIAILEQKLALATGTSEVRISDYFDLLAGTSTGGFLVALMLAPPDSLEQADSGGFNGESAVEIYYRYGNQIFQRSVMHRLKTLWGWLGPNYPAAPYEALLQQYLGSVSLAQLAKPCLITSYDTSARRAVFFTQHTAGRTEPDLPLWQVVRATTAAPTYFPPLKTARLGQTTALIDGGVFANNPALNAFVEAQKLFPALSSAKEMVMLSLGTGRIKIDYPHEKVERWGGVQWIEPLFDILTSAASETTSYEVHKLFEAEAAADQYLRVQMDVDPELSLLDDTSEKALKYWDELACQTAARLDKSLDYLVQLLLE